MEGEVRLHFFMHNAAFDENPHAEAARIFRDIADRIENGLGGMKIRDANGNTIGELIAEESEL